MKMTVRKKLLLVSLVPILIIGFVAIGITLTMVKTSLVNEIEDSLKGTASATMAAYDQNSGEYLLADNGDVWKGSYNISKSESLVDSIREETGMDVTFFYGSKRIMTSVMDADGDRILGSPAGDTIVSKVLEGGEEYFSKAVSLDGIINYGYYAPIYQKGDTTAPIGMIFVGADKAKKDQAINQIIYTITTTVAIIMLICIAAVTMMAASIASSLKESISLVRKVSKGHLSVQVSERLLKRKDEIGSLSRALERLQAELREIINQIQANTEELLLASSNLGDTARETTGTMKEVEGAVDIITQGASIQARDSQTATDHAIHMGEKISQTATEVRLLNQNAADMRRSSEKAVQTIQQLRNINEEVQQTIATITEQTNRTNESARKIEEATELISSIAEETNLLSLNASIEAARAGESGRGFAVVASQIQKLAEQSDESSNRIGQIIELLMADSDQAVQTMRHVQEIIDTQNSNMEQTEQIVDEVMDGIHTSIGSIGQIEQSTSDLDVSRKQMVEAVEGLSEVAQQNAASTEETSAATNEVGDTFEQIATSAEQLKMIADRLADSVHHFSEKEE